MSEADTVTESPPEAPPKPRRRTTRQASHEALAAAAQANGAEPKTEPVELPNGATAHLPVNDDGSPRFKPTIERLNTIAKRTVKTGQYEMFEISTMLEAQPDPRFSAMENIQRVQSVVVTKVNEMADSIQQQFQKD